MSFTQAFGLHALVERRIEEALARGVFNDLPGAGRPLDLDDELLVPDEVRVANRILKNAGVLPPDAQDLAEAQELLAAIERDADRAGSKSRRLEAIAARLDAAGRSATASALWHAYRDKLLARTSGAPALPTKTNAGPA